MVFRWFPGNCCGANGPSYTASSSPTPTRSEPIALGDHVRATFIDAGHILGSASILLELEENGRQRSVLFSGDIGNSGRPLLRDPVTPDHADVVVMETTYGDRNHKQLHPSIEQLYAAVNATFERGGNVIIPTFALERAQELLFFLREGMTQKKIRASTQVFLDSPMAISIPVCALRPSSLNGSVHPDAWRGWEPIRR